MDLFECLSDKDQSMIIKYLNDYAYNDSEFDDDNPPAPLSKILKCWSENKERLFNIFGQKLILERPIEMHIPKGELKLKIDKEFEDEDSAYRKFINEFKQLTIEGDSNVIPYSCKPYRYLYTLLHTSNAIIDNTYDGKRVEIPTPDGKVIVIEPGCKLMRMFGKIAKAYNLKEFDNFRIWHSQRLNTKTHKGTLCISIHPLDFMTMSDNECNWTSCMSWKECGGYRSGTVECMNSEYVIVAYLKSDNGDMKIGPDMYWNSKKWRSLFLVHDKVVTGIKGYPYQSSELSNAVLNWIRELLPNGDSFSKNVEYTYIDRGILIKDNPEPVFNITFITSGNMYNDFGTTNHYGMFVENKIPPYTKDHCLENILIIDYSGPFVCMYCGSINNVTEDESELICNDCSIAYKHFCKYCGCRLSRDSLFRIDDYHLCDQCYDDHCLCEQCYHEHTDYCPITNQRCYSDDMVQIFYIPEEEKRNDSTTNIVDTYCTEDNSSYISVNRDVIENNGNLTQRYPNIFARNSFFICEQWLTYYFVSKEDLTEEGRKMFEQNRD